MDGALIKRSAPYWSRGDDVITDILVALQALLVGLLQFRKSRITSPVNFN
jgi:hypothetical protein